MKITHFSETIAASDLKVGRSRHLIEFMKVSDLELDPRSCTYKTSNWIFSETTMPIWTKLCMKTFRYKEIKIWWHDVCYIFKSAATPREYVKNPSKVSFFQVIPGSSFEQAMMSRSHRCYKPSFMEIGSPVLEKIFEGFYQIWAWRPSWSCDLDVANKLLFPLPKVAPHKIWL